MNALADGNQPMAGARSWSYDVRQDLRYALRQLSRSRGTTALIVLTLAIGIGANATMAGAIDRLMLRPPAHVVDPDGVARLLLAAPNLPGRDHVSARSSYPAFLDLQQNATSFESLAATWSVTASLGTGIDAIEVRAALVSPTYFHVLGIVPSLGRLFSMADGYPTGATSGGPPLAVLGHGLWVRRFGADSGVIGRALRIGSLVYTVVGVAPAGLRTLQGENIDVWLPITVAAEGSATLISLAERGSAWLSIVGRLAPGATNESAATQATTIWRQMNAAPSSPDTARRIVAASIIRGRGPDAPREIRVALWLGGVSAIVLLIACANVANILMGRAFVRRREIAVRIALGAGRGRLTRQMLTEALLLAALGALAAAYLAHLAGGLLRHLFGAELADGRFMDVQLFAFTAIVALGTGVLISLAPLRQSLSPDLSSALRSGSASGAGRANHARAVMLGVQAALCMLLLVGAGLFAQSLYRVRSLDLGLDVEHTLMARFDLGRFALPRAEMEALYVTMMQRVNAVPGVRRSAFAGVDPYRAGQAVSAQSAQRTLQDIWDSGVKEVPMAAAVDSGFFRAVGAASLRGRDFSSEDRRGAQRVAIINAPLATLLWPDEDALGRCLYLSSIDRECIVVVGVLEGFWKFDVLERDKLVVYFPLAQSSPPVHPRTMFIAIQGDPAAVIPGVRRAIQSIRSNLPAVTVGRMRDVVEPAFRPWILGATMFGLFGGVALLIATVGLYGVVAFAVAQRSLEIGIRMALGARASHILTVVSSEALRAVGIGIAVGTLLALLLRRWIGPMLFQTSASDPVIIGVVAVMLFSVALMASVIPSARAMSRNPATTLRSE